LTGKKNADTMEKSNMLLIAGIVLIFSGILGLILQLQAIKERQENHQRNQ
jgi:UPF0716 family protein affecting phage T7 exclusion